MGQEGLAVDTITSGPLGLALADDLRLFLQSGAGSHLAFDIVAKIKPLEDVLADYRLSEAMLAQLLQNPIFAARVREANAAWVSSANTAERIAAKAQIQVEDAQLTLTQIASDERQPGSVRLQAIGQMAELAGLKGKSGVPTGRNQEDAAGPRLQVTFVFQNADQRQDLVIEAEEAA